MRILLIFYLVCIALKIEAQTPNDSELRKKYGFDNYIVIVDKYSLSEKDLKYTKGTKEFKTRIKDALKGEINFAGHCIFLEWGCGTGCQQSAIIDLKSKKVIFGPNSTTGYIYYPNSSLLIANPIDKDAPDYVLKKAEIFLWTSDTLKFQKSIDW